MPVRYIYIPVFSAYTCPQIRLSACLNRLFSMFADNREHQKSIALNTPTRATSNTTRIHQLGATLHNRSLVEGVARKRMCRRTGGRGGSHQPLQLRAPQSTTSTALPQASAPYVVSAV
jgi:hypothetical protein